MVVTRVDGSRFSEFWVGTAEGRSGVDLLRMSDPRLLVTRGIAFLNDSEKY
jgi:hypothetical protein